MTRRINKSLLLACVGIAALAANFAQAADMPQRPLPVPRAPAYVPFFTWNGIYVGINGAYGFGDSSWTDTFTTISTGNFNVDGLMIGGTLGYNAQFGSWVLGIEGDMAWSAIKGSTTTNCPLGCETSQSWFGTARARIGYAFDRFLPYLTGGGAFGNIRTETAGFAGTSSNQFGWTAGVGIEYAFLNNWSAKIEYLYADLGTATCAATDCGVNTTSL